MKKIYLIILIIILFFSSIVFSCTKETNIEGPPISLSDLKGKVVLLDFWAEWCGPCKSATPNIVSLYNEYKEDGFIAIGMNLDDESDFDKVVNYVNKSKIEYPIAIKSFSVAQEYEVSGIPRFVLIDKDGNISSIFVGYQETLYNDLKESIEFLLNEGESIISKPKNIISKEQRKPAINFTLPTLNH
ncbi:MAG TPA: TlpA disulfide reductase family protein [Caldisericia bacterium]|nr:TlpA disulfide reductase family protein [Caldisericia bacterium]